MMRKSLLVAGLATITLAPAWTYAQRTTTNVVTQASDAFGTSIGDERIGIYTSTNVRGFSPVSAGNIRLEGLSFDRPAGFTSRLTEGSTIRVGISAQGYPFPAPTGIVDFRLRKPGSQTIAAVGVSYGPLGGKSAEADIQLPLDGDRFGVTFGAGRYLDGSAYGSISITNAVALSARYAPHASLEIQPFWSRIAYRDDEAQPLIFTIGGVPPPEIKAGNFFGQDWTDSSGTLDNYGVIFKSQVKEFDIRAGVMRSIWRVNTTAADLLLNVDTNGNVGNRNIILQGDDKYGATSGELRISRTFAEGVRRHSLIAMVKARKLLRDYGGAQTINIDTAIIGEPDQRPAPIRNISPNNAADKITQTTVGLGYQGQWQNWGEIGLGVQHANYEKISQAPLPSTRATPTLINGNAAVYLSDQLAAYIGYTRGLEESPAAPLEAINRNQSPPAIRTIQKDVGVRWKSNSGITTVLGVFEIEKPYFNLDSARQFGRLGSVQHRGIEFSAAGKLTTNLAFVLGNLFIDRRVFNSDARADTMPIGSFRHQSFLNLNYVVPDLRELSLTSALESTGRRVTNTVNTQFVPGRITANMGARYRFMLGDKQALVRLRVDNIFNKFSWDVTSSGAFVVNSPRRYSIDFGLDL
jgi:iron complex outermembrane recepter protein